jgi:hypothetical protein
VEVYVDHIVIKSITEKDLLRDIDETFQKLRAYNIKLNTGKCSFGDEEGKFLGVVVTKDGLQANPEKVCAITTMPSPETLKHVQTLNGRVSNQQIHSQTRREVSSFHCYFKKLHSKESVSTERRGINSFPTAATISGKIINPHSTSQG